MILRVHADRSQSVWCLQSIIWFGEQRWPWSSFLLCACHTASFFSFRYCSIITMIEKEVFSYIEKGNMYYAYHWFLVNGYTFSRGKNYAVFVFLLPFKLGTNFPSSFVMFADQRTRSTVLGSIWSHLPAKIPSTFSLSRLSWLIIRLFTANIYLSFLLQRPLQDLW